MPGIHIEDSIYYITTNVYGQIRLFISPSFIIPIIDSLNYYRFKLQFKIFGYVIMPDHLHIIIWPQGLATISDIMRDFKKFTAVRLIRQAKVEKHQALLDKFAQAGEKTKRGANKVWQDGSWDSLVYSQAEMRQKLNYIHRNPVRAGLVEEPGEYPYSSFRNYVYDDNSLIVVDKDWL